MKMSRTPAVLQLCHHLQPELRRFGLVGPHPEHLLQTVEVVAVREIDRLVANVSGIADLEVQPAS